MQIFLSTLPVFSLPSIQRILALPLKDGFWVSHYSQGDGKLRRCRGEFCSDQSPSRCWQEFLVWCPFSVVEMLVYQTAWPEVDIAWNLIPKQQVWLLFVGTFPIWLGQFLPSARAAMKKTFSIYIYIKKKKSEVQFKRWKFFSGGFKLLFHLFFIEMIFRK